MKPGFYFVVVRRDRTRERHLRTGPCPPLGGAIGGFLAARGAPPPVRTPVARYTANVGLRDSHRPLVKSGHLTGTLPLTIDSSDSGMTALMTTES